MTEAIRQDGELAAVDRWLAAGHMELITDLTSTLDLQAGLRDATLPTRHTELVDGLNDMLDIEAGLASILPITPPTHPRMPIADTVPSPDQDRAMEGADRPDRTWSCNGCHTNNEVGTSTCRRCQRAAGNAGQTGTRPTDPSPAGAASAGEHVGRGGPPRRIDPPVEPGRAAGIGMIRVLALTVAVALALWLWADPARHRPTPAAGAAAATSVAGSAPRPVGPLPTAPSAMLPVGRPMSGCRMDVRPDDYRQVRCPAGPVLTIPARWQIGEPPDGIGQAADGISQAADPNRPDIFLCFGATTPPGGTLRDYLLLGEHNPNIQTGYRRIALRPVGYLGAEEAMDWEFTFTTAGQPRHVRARYWLANGNLYLIYASAPAADWPVIERIFPVR